jgi:hypothetical protein
MRRLYRVSEGQTSGNGGTICAPVSAKFLKTELGKRTDVSKMPVSQRQQLRRSRSATLALAAGNRLVAGVILYNIGASAS